MTSIEEVPATDNLQRPQRLRSGSQCPRPLIYRREVRNSFGAETSITHRKKSKGHPYNLESLYLGIAVVEAEHGFYIGFACHDGARSVDFNIRTLYPKVGADRAAMFASDITNEIDKYEVDKMIKFMGAGLSTSLAQLSPQLPALLWSRLDIVPFVIDSDGTKCESPSPSQVTVDQEADRLARDCLSNFGPNNQPRLVFGDDNEVFVDSLGRSPIHSLEEYQKTVGSRTWDATVHYARLLKENGIKIAFFNSTPQGGGVALMRHALIRFLRCVGVDAHWYIPAPKPEVFRITKNNHNILQGVAESDLRLPESESLDLDTWCSENAARFWTCAGGPLAPPAQGGAHLIVVDDPQMPSLVKIAKSLDPNRPVIFRSHIQVRADLANIKGSPTSQVWNWVWDNVKAADIFISHPVRDFIPANVDVDKVGYMPATTDWLDGLNKTMSPWDTEYHLFEFENECFKARMHQLAFLSRPHIVQIARFDPSKGIPDVLASYAEFRRKYTLDMPLNKIPQLVLAGHGAIDDPDATWVYDQTIDLLKSKYADIESDVIVMRLGPSDQILNALISTAHVVLQLSTREGFEAKVSEALRKGVPVIASRAGGIPLQVEDGKSGFLVAPGDYEAVARHLSTLFADEERYTQMADYACEHVSDEVSTVGNALCWMYLANKLTGTEREGFKMGCRWVNDLARDDAGCGYVEGEVRLPRGGDLDLRKVRR